MTTEFTASTADKQGNFPRAKCTIRKSTHFPLNMLAQLCK